MNLDFFDALCRREYSRLELEGDPCSWTVEEVLKVFHLFFKWYELYSGEIHPNLTALQIQKYIKLMPVVWYDNGYYGKPVYDPYGDVIDREKDPDDPGDQIDLFPEDYEELIPTYFQTRYQRGCNYRVHHFFSGSVRTFLMLKLKWL